MMHENLHHEAPNSISPLQKSAEAHIVTIRTKLLVYSTVGHYTDVQPFYYSSDYFIRRVLESAEGRFFE